MKTGCSLVIATYNWPEALQLCLQSVLQQKTLPNQVIIADDGSDNRTKLVVDEFLKNCPVPLLHVWQEDEGFQLAKIRNKGIAQSSNEYIIQIDGDLILHPYFVHDHLQISEQGYFVSGSRVLLSSETTNALFTHQSIDIHQHNKGSKNFFNKLRSGLLRQLLSKHYKTKGKNKYYVKGCNMAFWKKDLVKVNGYNEAFTGWGREDNELAIRLINAGVKKKFLKMGGITYHLHHKEASRELDHKNSLLMEQAIAQKLVTAEKGVNQYL